MAVTVGHIGDRAYIFFALSTDTLPTTLASGLNIPIGSDLYFTDINQQLKWSGSAWFTVVETEDNYQAPYYENTSRGLKFANQFASNALAASTTAAIDVIINPTGSGKKLVLVDAFTAITAMTAVATGTNVCLGWFAAAVTPTHGTAQTPQNLLVGNATASIAVCAPTATVLVAPAFLRTIASLYGDLAASDILGVRDDIKGSIVIPPGNGVAVYGVTGTVADVTVQVALTWDEIPA